MKKDTFNPPPTPLQRALRRLMRAAVYGSTACLLAGLLAWMLDHDSRYAAVLLPAGLITLMGTPALRVVISAVDAIRLKDWLFLALIASVAVLLAAAVTLATRQ